MQHKLTPSQISILALIQLGIRPTHTNQNTLRSLYRAGYLTQHWTGKHNETLVRELTEAGKVALSEATGIAI